MQTIDLAEDPGVEPTPEALDPYLKPNTQVLEIQLPRCS